MTVEFNQCLLRIFALPLVLVIGEGDNRFHIIHAEAVKPDHNEDGQTVWLDSDIDQWFSAKSLPFQMHERLMWGRHLFYSSRFNKQKFEAKQPGLSTTFCGHTPALTPYQVLSHLCVDTGAYFTLDDLKDEGYGLTLFDVHDSRWFTASYIRDEIMRGNFIAEPEYS